MAKINTHNNLPGTEKAYTEQSEQDGTFNRLLKNKVVRRLGAGAVLTLLAGGGALGYNHMGSSTEDERSTETISGAVVPGAGEQQEKYEPIYYQLTPEQRTSLDERARGNSLEIIEDAQAAAGDSPTTVDKSSDITTFEHTGNYENHTVRVIKTATVNGTDIMITKVVTGTDGSPVQTVMTGFESPDTSTDPSATDLLKRNDTRVNYVGNSILTGDTIHVHIENDGRVSASTGNEPIEGETRVLSGLDPAMSNPYPVEAS